MQKTKVVPFLFLRGSCSVSVLAIIFIFAGIFAGIFPIGAAEPAWSDSTGSPARGDPAAGDVAGDPAVDPACEGEGGVLAPFAITMPSIEDLRGIQYEYSPLGSLVVVEWNVVDGAFDEIRAFLGEESYLLVGNAEGISFRNVAPGPQAIRVEGTFQGTVVSRKISFTVLPSCPVAPVTIWSCLYFAHDPKTGTGLLQIAWDTPSPPPGDSFMEFEVRMDGKFLLVTRTLDGAVTVSGAFEGNHTVGIIGITSSYASRETRRTFQGIALPPPEDLSLLVNCDGVKPFGKLSYEVPDGVAYDAIAVWMRPRGIGPWEFRGYFTDPDGSAGGSSTGAPDGGTPSGGGPAVYLPDLPEGMIDLEACLVLFEQDHETPRAISNLPGKTSGSHAIIREVIDCGSPIEFLRGDADANGRVNLTDTIRILSYLFLGVSSLSCPLSADVDDNDILEITDGIGILSFLFMGGSEPEPPGPWTCGVDPTPGNLWGCSGGSCDS
jgi:hypothetical protein